MTIYIFGIAASKSGIRVNTMEAYDNIELLGKRIIREFENRPVRNTRYSRYETQSSLEDFVKDYRHFRVYLVDLNSSQKSKKISGKKIWEAMQREEGLKKDITKALLKEGSSNVTRIQ